MDIAVSHTISSDILCSIYETRLKQDCLIFSGPRIDKTEDRDKTKTLGVLYYETEMTTDFK